MDALFLHLDEELTNSRPDRLRGDYSPADLAFWLQFYSLFYDSLYIPANFITDSNNIPEVFSILRIGEGSSTLVAPDLPFKILWDESRFPHDSTEEMLESFLAPDAEDVSMRDPETARHSARLADKYLREQVVGCKKMSVLLDRLESVEQLKRDVFDPGTNSALTVSTAGRLQECLQRIVDRGAVEGYGRNFYYKVFGYGRTESQRRMGDGFRDIVDDYRALTHEFLTGVDYVSHRLKAHFAARALGRRVEVLMPAEYLWVVCRPDKAATATQNVQQGLRVRVDAGYRRIIEPSMITRMTAGQLRTLHESSEYRQYGAAWREVRGNGAARVDEAELRHLEGALNEYLDRVAAVLNPRGHRFAAGLRMVGHAVSTLAGLSAYVALEVSEWAAAVPDGTGVARSVVELLGREWSDKATSVVMPMRPWPFHTCQFGEDVTIVHGSG